MAHEEDLDTVWRLLEKTAIGMLTTRHGEALHSRPMSLHADRAAGAIRLLTDANTHKDDAIRMDPHVNLALIEGSKYLSVSGTAQVTNDRAGIGALWSPAAQAWWDGPDDPDVRLLTIRPREAHYWRTPGKLLSSIAMLALASGDAVAIDANPATGEEKRVRM